VIQSSGRVWSKCALTLLELLVVLLILGVLAALAVPRFSRAAVDSPAARVRESLSLLRNAIERYYLDHGAYPGQHDDGVSGPGTPAAFVNQLTRFTDERGDVSKAKDATHAFGPYLRKGIPPCPVPPRAGMTGVALSATPPRYIATAAEAGWIFNCQTGDVAANSDEVDGEGLPYDQY
jgi:prepilin-type N-terminal cleavage/methylation domain-containing protein